MALTDHQLQLLSLTADGLTTREIAQELGRSVETIKSRKKTLVAKLGVVNMCHAVYVTTPEIIEWREKRLEWSRERARPV